MMMHQLGCIENYPPFIENYGPPPYRKLQPLISAFKESSIFENNRDPCAEESRVKRKEEIAQRRKSKRTVMREVSPACEYERIRVANIAERMELFQMLDIGGAVAGAKQ